MFKEWAVNLFYDVCKRRLSDKVKKAELETTINKYLESQNKFNEQSNLSDEIDFQGLSDYISVNMITDFEQRLFGNLEERRRARESIRNKAIYYSSTLGKKKLNKKFVKLCRTSLTYFKIFAKDIYQEN